MVRPRSAAAHRKVVEAAIQLFAKEGIDATSMDAIATASGVSKATIYKHWADKDALALEAVSYLFGFHEDFPDFASGDLRTDLIDCLSYESPHMPELRERMMPHLMAYSVRNQAFGRAWRERVINRRRSALAKLYQRGVAEGMLPRHLDPEISTALLFGPILYRHIFDNYVGGKRSPSGPPRTFVEQVVDSFLRSFGTETKRLCQ
ncbi:MAG TPA: TetR/AcrR family transcriptional regulator [Terriglobales bacterium]|nr:TetR/AcrR family transcriptional regulator [Terriglobales bacterium]